MESIAQIKSKFEAVGLFDMAVHACYKEACAEALCELYEAYGNDRCFGIV